MTLDELIAKFPKAKRQPDGSFLVKCVAHQDKNPSLHISQKDDTILMKCHAGCSTEAVCHALGIELSDLFIEPNQQASVSPVTKKIVATYDYKDEQGQPLFQVVRYDPKAFAQRHKNGNNEWVWSLEGVRRVLYNLPEVLKAGKVYLVEGEKDADNLTKIGLTATTSPGGASNWRPEYTDYLAGKQVVIIPDQDKAGYEYAKGVTATLKGKVSSLTCILLPDGFKDISDWLKLQDFTGLHEEDIKALDAEPIKF